MISGWIAWVAPLAVFSVMLSLGLILTSEHVVTALRRPAVLLAVVFAAVVPLPLLAVAAVSWLDLEGPVALGILLMSIAPGAPVALRRAIEAGSPPHFAPTLHLAIVLTAVVSVPALNQFMLVDLVPVTQERMKYRINGRGVTKPRQWTQVIGFEPQSDDVCQQAKAFFDEVYPQIDQNMRKSDIPKDLIARGLKDLFAP